MKIAKKSLTPIKKNGPFTPDTFQKLVNPHISDSWEDDDDDDDDEGESLGRHLQNKITIITSPVLRSKRLSAKKCAGNSNKKKPQQQELLVADKEVIDLTDAFEKILVQDEDEPEEKEEVSDKAPRKATPFKVKSSYMSSIIPHTPIRSTGKTIGFADLTDDGNDDVEPVVKQEEKEDDPNLGLCDARDDNGDTVRRSRRNNKRTSV